MYKLFLSLLLTGILVFSFSRDQQSGQNSSLIKAYMDADKLFTQAEQLSLRGSDDEKVIERTDNLYLQALSHFKALIPKKGKLGNDSLAFFIHTKTAFIDFCFDSIETAKKNYLTAISLKAKLPALADSFLFSPLLFTGAIYYSQNQFDSALLFYKKAEQLNDLYKKQLNKSQRLYNLLGVMYYETGNYGQARNYFEKAIALLPANASDKTLLANYKINIASLLVKLEDFSQAQSVYQSVLPYNIFNDEINHNLGIISFKRKEYTKALGYFRKVNYSDNKKTIDLYYNFGITYSALNQSDSAELYFQKALAENIKWNGHRKNITHGLILKYQADELARQQYYREAAVQYQLAIIQFDNTFSDSNYYKNPVLYSGVFSYINLFNTLTSKATVLEALYKKEKDIIILEASLDAYRSAFRLIDYVEKTYTSDDARLFLGKIIYAVHSNPIDISLQLFNLTKKRNYLEEAYFFDQRNKASVLSFNVSENELNNLRTTNNELLSKQSLLKSSITRLSLKAAQTTDSVQLSQINASIRDGEIELGKLEEKLNDDPLLQQKISAGKLPSVNQLQRKLDNTTALLSFHLSDNELLTLLITSNQFEYRSTVINKSFFSEIESFKEALQNTSSEETYNGTTSSMSLYQTLISPVQPRLAKIKKLIIIPDDELNYLPFEALQDENRRYLVEKFTVQYQYSTALLGKGGGNLQSSNTLAFAPFATYNYSDTTGNLLNRLPASADEVNTLQGKIFIDSIATKNNFLQSANHYSIIHLATHATVNNNDPFQSFITFNPVNSDYKLYAQEIYNLNLDSTQLIILSACETGAGKLVKGEGLMSLSRAFAYAGCPNIITSLWKAEDKTTSFITQRLHYYLSENFSKDKALQLAKLDLLHSNDIDPRFKTPGYWAHLIFIGSYEPDHKRNNWKWVAIGIIVTLMGYQFAKKKGLTLKRQASSS
jgi:CHAT domain-containing protein/Tfp pilus assembly protein PilF